MAQANLWGARFEAAKHSVVYIEFGPKPGMVHEIQRIADRVMSIQDDEERLLAVWNPSTCIGFVHGSTGDDRQVMTTAHALQHVYSWGDPLTVEKTDLFRASVVCYHQEEERRQAGMPEEARRYAEAKITATAWAQDVLLLTVGAQALRGLHHDDEVCPGPHPALPVAPNMPRTAVRCMLLAWPAANGPPPRDAMGWTSSARDVGMMSTNDLGYRMMLLEVYVDSVAGMSGAPLLDAGGTVIGMLHGGFGGTHSYFVASPHLYRWERQNQPRTPRYEVVEEE